MKGLHILVRRWDNGQQEKVQNNMFFSVIEMDSTLHQLPPFPSPGLSSLCVAARGFIDISQSGRKSNHY